VIITKHCPVIHFQGWVKLQSTVKETVNRLPSKYSTSLIQKKTRSSNSSSSNGRGFRKYCTYIPSFILQHDQTLCMFPPSAQGTTALSQIAPQSLTSTSSPHTTTIQKFYAILSQWRHIKCCSSA